MPGSNRPLMVKLGSGLSSFGPMAAFSSTYQLKES